MARLTETVLLPTPPLPLITRIFFLIRPKDALIAIFCRAVAASAEPQLPCCLLPQLPLLHFDMKHHLSIHKL